MRQTKLDSKKLASTVHVRVRESLNELGFSSVKPIDDINFNYLPFYHSKDAVDFLKAVQRLYEKFDPLQRQIFTFEFLEMGEHHIFWWMRYFKKEEFRSELNEIASLVYSDLGGLLYERASS